MDARKAGALALTIVSVACRLGAIFLCALTAVLCFSRAAAALNLVGFVVDLSQALPGAIAGYGLMATPFGGVFRLDFAAVAALLLVVDYLCVRASRALRRRGGRS